MSTETKIDPFKTPVWALYTSSEDAAILHGVLVPFNYRGPTLETAMWGEGGRWTSRTGWTATREELIEKEGIREACSECGNPFATTNWCKPIPEQLQSRNLCFYCNHWLHSVIPHHGEAGRVVIKGQMYSWDYKRPMVKIEGGGGGYGFGGRLFAIRLHSGEEIRTNNLWSGGVIPQRFLARLPDNADFTQIPQPIGHGQGFLS